MTWYITAEGSLLEATPTESEEFVRCHYFHPLGTAIVIGKFDMAKHIEITKEVADIMRGV